MGSIEKLFKTGLWGVSIALAWTWGIGLFFSVQMAVQFGLSGLITYATINAFGLTAFGLVNSFLAKRYKSNTEYENGFLSTAKNFKFPFFLYQFLAITLTLFAILKYVTLPIGILSILVCVMFVGASIFLGEEFGIKRIKYSHAVIFLGVLATLGFLVYLGYSKIANPDTSILGSFDINGVTKSTGTKYFFFFIPIAVGFLLGPWLDLQHWQRALQIHKEGLSIAKSYIVGGIVFWSIIVGHGFLGLCAFNISKASVEAFAGDRFFFHLKDIITRLLSQNTELQGLLWVYVIFICLAALATFDSGYVALKWYSKELIKDSKSIILSIIPEKFVISPLSWFVLCSITAMTTLHFAEIGKFIGRLDPSLVKFFQFELEYYMAFYATFFVVYAVVLIRSLFDTKGNSEFHFLKLLSTGLCSLSVFGIGYFTSNTLIMAFAALIPLIYGLIVRNLETSKEDTKASSSGLDSSSPNGAVPIIDVPKAEIIPASNYQIPDGATLSKVPGCFIDQEKWFIHTFIPTYQDTNSVGNIYFAMYGMWVGKTRELFFLHAMPDFDPKTSKFLILTRSYDHKFLRETKEFERVSIHIRIKDYNRKFVTMEHKILNSNDEMLGKGTQSLMFVSSADYGLIDIPDEAFNSFMPFIGHISK